MKESAEGSQQKEECLVEVKLPSLGKPYGIGEIVRIRPMRTVEEKYFSSMIGMARTVDVISKLIEKCSTIEIDPLDLLVDDRLFLLFKLRAITYGPVYVMEFNCMNCNRLFSQKMDIDEVEVKYLEGDEVGYSVKLPIRGDLVQLRRLTGRDDKAIAEYEKQVGRATVGIQKEPGSDRMIEGDVTYIYRLARAIDKVNGRELSTLDKRKYVEGLYGKDSLAIRNAIDDNILGIPLEVGVECPNCGMEDVRFLPVMTAEFFRPRKS